MMVGTVGREDVPSSSLTRGAPRRGGPDMVDAEGDLLDVGIRQRGMWSELEVEGWLG
jgi:hypothetical protein